MLTMYKPCPGPCQGTGQVTEDRYYRQPPPGDAVWAAKYTRPAGSTLVRVQGTRACVRCGGKGEVPA